MGPYSKWVFYHYQEHRGGGRTSFKEKEPQKSYTRRLPGLETFSLQSPQERGKEVIIAAVE